MTTHMPGPWRVAGDEPNAVITDDIFIARCAIFKDGPGSMDYHADGCSPTMADANAARIVASVNACGGINPEAVPKLLAACQKYIRLLDHDDTCEGHEQLASIEAWLDVNQEIRAAVARATEKEAPK